MLDCETTGLYNKDRIVEIAALTLDPETWEPVDEYDTLINPERDISNTEVHGITASMVEGAPTFQEVAATLARRLHGAIIIAHNLDFDTRMLRLEFEREGVSFNPGSGLCTYKTNDRLSLSDACCRNGITISQQHRALADARAAAALVRKEVLDEIKYELTPARLAYVELPITVRTLRREFADAENSNLTRSVSHPYFPCADEALLCYLDALDWILDDGYIDDDERKYIEKLAKSLGISFKQCVKAHRDYLNSIIKSAERDDIITDSEKRIIDSMANVLGVTDVMLPDATRLPEADRFSEGMAIYFSGGSLNKEDLKRKAVSVGMNPAQSVTKNCDIVVAADPSSQSGNVRKAHRYGIPVIGVEEFHKRLAD